MITITSLAEKYTLHSAIIFKKYAALKFLISENYPVNQLDFRGNHALHLAIAAGDLFSVRILLTSPIIDINCRDHEGKTPLMLALMDRQIRIIAALLSRRPNLHLRDCRGISILQSAIETGNIGILRDIINSPQFDQGPLRVEYFNLLQKVYFSKGHSTSLNDEVWKETIVSRILIWKVFNSQKYGSSFLGVSVEQGRLELVLAAIQRFPTLIQLVDEKGKTLLHLAATYGRLEILSFLLREGIEIDRVDINGNTAFLAACEGNLREMKELLSAGANGFCCNSNGQNALHIAVSEGYREGVEFLLHHRPQLAMIEDGAGFTPYDLAVCYRFPEIINLLERFLF